MSFEKGDLRVAQIISSSFEALANIVKTSCSQEKPDKWMEGQTNNDQKAVWPSNFEAGAIMRPVNNWKPYSTTYLSCLKTAECKYTLLPYHTCPKNTMFHFITWAQLFKVNDVVS